MTADELGILFQAPLGRQRSQVYVTWGGLGADGKTERDHLADF